MSRAGSGEIAAAGGRATEVTMLEGARPGAKLLVEADGARSGTLGSPELDDEAARIATELLWSEECHRRGALFFDVTAPTPRLIVFGAVDIAAPSARSRVRPDCAPMSSTPGRGLRAPSGFRTPSR